MSESIKFGPKWLRNSLSNSPSTHDESTRPIMSEYRYSREEMLGLVEEKNCKKNPEILTNYRRLFVPVSQNPILLEPIDEEKPPVNNNNANNNGGNSRLFINSNIKHGANHWKKGGKEDADENWRYPCNKENKEVFYSPYTSKPTSSKNWREKSTKEDPFLKSTEYKPEKEDDMPNNFGAIEPKREFPQTSTNKSNEKILENFMDLPNKPTAVLFENCKIIKHDEPKIDQSKNILSPTKDENLNACELNLKKLENDLLMNLADLSIDEEKISERVNDNKKKSNISWFYIDPKRMIQGPFGQEEMSIWYQHGFFYDNLMLRRSIDNNFYPLKHLIQAFGPIQPFTIASAGFPLPNYDNHLENMQYQFKKPPPPILNQWNMMPPQIDHSNQFQNFQFQPNIAQSYQFQLQNRQHQQPIHQIDPRMMPMNNGNPYVQTYNNVNMNRPPPQLMSNFINQMPGTMKNQMSGPIVNQFTQSMIQQMPAIIPPNPIQKLIYDLQKHKEYEQQVKNQAMYFQRSNSSNNNMPQQNNQQSMNHQPIQQQVKAEMNQNTEFKQPYFSNNIVHDSFVNNHHVEKNKESFSTNFDADDEGEFRVVGNIKRKRFQKDVKDKQHDKVKDNGSRVAKLSTKLKFYENNYAKSYKKMNDEKSKFPAMPAPWIKKDRVGAENLNLNRIQNEEEKNRKIQNKIQREMEKNREAKKNDKKMTWNSVVTENLDKSDTKPKEETFWDVPHCSQSTSKKNANKNEGQASNKKEVEQVSLDTNKDMENEFKDWSIEEISKINTSIDLPVFVNFIFGLESPFEVEDYIKMYLGESIDATLFIRKFLERRSSLRKAIKIVEIDDDLCAPPKAINPGSNEESHKANKKKQQTSKKSKKAMKVADNNILGFKATAASNRIVGELHDDEY